MFKIKIIQYFMLLPHIRMDTYNAISTHNIRETKTQMTNTATLGNTFENYMPQI